jgi:uncharacterized coiled-coil protein SlyX
VPDLDHLTLGQAMAGFLLLTTVLGAVGAWWKWLLPRWRDLVADVRKARDSIVGRDAIVDSITDEVRVPALPGIGVRMAHQEQQMELLTVTVTKLVDQQVHQQRLEQRVDAHDNRIKKLEEAQVERVVSRVESTAAFRAIEEAIKATPDAEGDVVEPPQAAED